MKQGMDWRPSLSGAIALATALDRVGRSGR